MPGYSGGPDYKQDYTIRYREAGSEWQTIPVASGSTEVTINSLSPNTTYEFQIAGKNAIGEGMMSKLVAIKTLGKLHFLILFDFKINLLCEISLN